MYKYRGSTTFRRSSRQHAPSTLLAMSSTTDTSAAAVAPDAAPLTTTAEPAVVPTAEVADAPAPDAEVSQL